MGNVTQWAATFGSLVFLLQQGLPVIAAAACAVAALATMAAALRYWHFRFRLEEDRVRIREGVFKKRELNAQFDRIQGINVEQSPIYRLLGLVTVSFDTAGSTKREGHLPAVTPSFAESLRAQIDSARPRRATRECARTDSAARDDVLVQLDNADMIRIGLTDFSALAGLVAIPFFLQASEDARKLSMEMFEQAAAGMVGLGMLAVLGVAATGLVAACVAFVMVTTATAFLRFHGFTLRQEGGALHTRRGLLTRKELRVQLRKVQHLAVTQSLRLRCCARFRLRAPSASSGPADARSAQDVREANLAVPLMDADGVLELGRQAFGDEGRGLVLLPGAGGFAGISPAYIRARLLVRGIVPAALATVALLPSIGSSALLALGWVPLVGAVAWQRWRRYGYRHDDHGLSCRSGLFACRVDAFLFRKAQGARIWRSPLQRRKGLASLYVALASGAVVVPYIDHAKACQLRDYILYKAESSRRPWH